MRERSARGAPNSMPTPSGTVLKPYVSVDELNTLLVEQVSDYAIFMLDVAGYVVTWNAGAERMKGYRAGEIIGQHFSRFYRAEDVWKCEHEIDVATREGRVEDEGWRVRKGGTRFWANVVITAVHGPAGNVIGFAKVTRDLTERRAAEEERERIARLAIERIRALTDLSEALAGALSIADVSRVVTENGSQLAHADTCTLYLLDEHTRTLELIAERGCNPKLLESIRRITPDSRNPAYAVGSGARRAIWAETEQEYRALYPALFAREPEAGPRALAFGCVPLVAEGKTIGMVGVGFHSMRSFSEEEREFVATFARQCAQALARAGRVEAEREAAALAERLGSSLATTLRSIGDAVIATDPAGSITLMNGVAEALTGWTEREARGQPLGAVYRIVDARTHEPRESPVRSVIETGATVGLANHTLLLARDGRAIAIDDSGAPIRAGAGSIDGVVLVFRDVSARKQAEARRSFLTEATGVLTESLDYETTVARVAELCVPLLADGCAVDLLVEGESRPKRLAVARSDAAQLQLAPDPAEKQAATWSTPSGIAQVLRTGKAELYQEIALEQLQLKADTREPLRTVSEPLLCSAMILPLVARGRVLGAMSFIYTESGRRYGTDDLEFAEDLARRCATAIENARLFTAEQRSRRAADIANRAKDEFLAVVSHELRTPLNAIMGWAKLLASSEFDEERQRSAIETIARNAVAMRQLIEDLLDMSRVISGKMRLEVQNVDISQVVGSAIESIRPAAAARSVELSTVLDNSTGSLMGDPTRLQQVVWNLLSNAVKFTPKGGSVRVITRRIESSLEISVADSGMGIAAGFLPYVFDPFRQADASSTRSRGGLGLGLAITRQLVELHGGKITVESAGEGCGTTFTVVLPISAVAPRPTTLPAERRFGSEPPLAHPEHLRGLRVLVVDDEPDARDLIAAILRDCGCLVTTAVSTEQALASLALEVPDVLVSDVGMPERDGYDLIHKVRSLPRDRGGDIPAAALTAFARAEDRRNLLNAGFSMHLPKPVEPAELVAVVATLSRFMRRAR